MSHNSSESNSSSSLKNSLTLAALGVVFGDIGTSPLYAFREAFQGHVADAALPEYVLGVLSLIIWSLISIVSIKYLFFVMRANNNGEGGVLALTTLISKTVAPRFSKILFISMGIFGAALLFGDGVLTPSISILSAVEGISLAAPNLTSWVIPITLVIIFALFYLQKNGTQKIGTVFGPIIFTWFSILALLGLYQIIKNPASLAALNPLYGFNLLAYHVSDSLIILSAVFLSITGTEALYADMGHFGVPPIKKAWFYVAFPALIINYMGQASLILQNPSSVTNPFYLMAPSFLLYPLIAFATLAAIIASQALITGIFSITKQAIQLGYSPRVGVVHTSGQTIGQIFVPKINWGLCILAMWSVISFKSSSNLASAYGVAVSLTMLITTILISAVAYYQWKQPLWRVALFFIAFIIIDISFLGANLVKFSQGGWFPIMIGITLFTVMITWKQGRLRLISRLQKKSLSINQFLEDTKNMDLQFVHGTAFYLSGDPDKCPLALLHNIKHNKVWHDRIFILNVRTNNVPKIKDQERLKIEKVGSFIHKVVVEYGYMEKPNIKHIIHLLNQQEYDILINNVAFFLGRENLNISNEPGWPTWKKYLFSFLSNNSERANMYFNIPSDQVIEVGVQVDI